MRQQADLQADSVIETIVKEGGKEEAKKLFDLLNREIELPVRELPKAAQDFVAAHDRLPHWVKPTHLQIAQDLFEDHGPKFLLFLYFKSLPMLYACAHGAKVLTHSGRLSHQAGQEEIFTRRIAETGQFLVEVMSPGNLAPGGAGIRAILKIRLIYAAIRYFTQLGSWDKEKWGKPINQEDLAITLFTFSIALTDGLEQFGIYEPREREVAFYQTWRGIGYLMGIQEEIMPTTLQEAEWLLGKILHRQAKSSEEGLLLTKALLEFARKHMPLERLKYAPELIMLHLLGDELAQDLAIKRPSGCLVRLVPGFLKSYFNVMEKLEDKNEPLHDLLDKLSDIAVKGMIRYFDQYAGHAFRIAPKLREKWKMDEN